MIRLARELRTNRKLPGRQRSGESTQLLGLPAEVPLMLNMYFKIHPLEFFYAFHLALCATPKPGSVHPTMLKRA